MKIIELNKAILPEWAGTIPEELFIDLMLQKNRYFAAGVTFMDEIAGAVCWEESEAAWTLRSIYVFPEFRRLGLGTELMDYVTNRMEKKQGRTMTVSYYNDDDLVMLSPFLTHCGINMELVELPAGSTDVQTVAQHLQLKNLEKKIGRYSKLSDLTQKERQLCDSWMLGNLGVHIDAYENVKPASYALLDGRNVLGILLFREVDEVIRLEYCKVKSEAIVRVIPLMALAAENLSRQYAGKTKLEMILSSDQAINLYSRLIGGATEKTSICCGYYIPNKYNTDSVQELD